MANFAFQLGQWLPLHVLQSMIENYQRWDGILVS